MKTIVNFSGGRTSAYLSYILKQTDLDLAFVFANTGKEREETLEFVNKCDKEWGLGVVWIESVISQTFGIGPKYRIVDFESASRNGEPFTDMVDKFGIPNSNFPHCTRELKHVPIKKWAKENFPEHRMAIGIRIDERTRVKGHWYPLVTDFPTTKLMVRQFWANQPFDLNLKDYEGNCDLCWKKSQRKRLTLIKENPGIEKQWAEWEDRDEYVFDRAGLTIKELVEKSKTDFNLVVDEFMDIETKCACE